MKESSLWQTVKRELQPFGSVMRVENMLGAGTPDVAFSLQRPSGERGAGWLELKQLAKWPSRDDTTVNAHLTLEQAMWLRSWSRTGIAFVLLQVGREYLLIDSPMLLHERSYTRDSLRAEALVWAEGAFPRFAILKHLTPWR